MNAAATFRTRPAEVEAIRWTGPDNCEHVHAFINWDHSDDDPPDHHKAFGTGDDRLASPGYWFVRIGDDRYQVLTDDEFRAQYEACDA